MRDLNKGEKSPREGIFGVCKIFIRKLTDYFFVILDLWTKSFENGSLFTWLKSNAPSIKHFGTIYTNFDEYPWYSGRTSAIFEKIVRKVFNVIMVMLILQAKKLHMG